MWPPAAGRDAGHGGGRGGLLGAGPCADLSGAAGLADFIEHLRPLRAYTGNPSFRVLTRRVGRLLKPPQEVTHSTVSDVFDPPRRRLNQELVAAVEGMAGVGKTQLAVRVAHELV